MLMSKYTLLVTFDCKGATSAVARIELERPGFLREEKRLEEEERGKRREDKPARKSDGVALEEVNETLRSLVELQAAAGLRAPICETFREPGNEPTFDRAVKGAAIDERRGEENLANR